VASHTTWSECRCRKLIIRTMRSTEHLPAGTRDFERRFSRRDLEHADLPIFSPAGEARDFVSVVVEAYARCFGIARSRSDARRLIEGGSVQWGGEKIVDPKASLPTGSSGVLKLDKTRAVRIR
jgi:tyrosyl-tRNA synthetase